MESTPLTIGLFGLGASCVGGGLWFAMWLAGQLKALKKEILSHVDTVRIDLDRLKDKVAEVELATERNFISKATANLVFERLESGIKEVRHAVDAGRSSTEARLIRIESHLQPTSHLPPAARARES